MRLIVNGQQAFGKAVLEALLERGETVVGVYCAPDQAGRPVDPLKELAVVRGVPVFQPASFKDPAVAAQMRSLDAELGVMAYVTRFVPEAVLSVPARGTIQYHPSLLPMHKGPSSINWPIIFGETTTGLTVFWPDDGLDTGPILLQKKVAIGPDDTLGSLYFEQLFPLGVAALLEAVDRVRDGTAPKIPQDSNAGSYESWCRKADARIDWRKPADAVYNLIRGTNPQPGAWTEAKGKTVQIFDSEKVADAAGAPGEIVAIAPSGITVAAGNGGILVKRMRPERGGKATAADFAAAAGLHKGDRFG